jgi:hypothetical protein
MVKSRLGIIKSLGCLEGRHLTVRLSLRMPLLTENEIKECTCRSLKEGICGIVNCYNKPTKKCKKCKNYYCSEHFPPHLDLLPDDTFEYSSSNVGLDWYTD